MRERVKRDAANSDNENNKAKRNERREAGGRKQGEKCEKER